MSAAPYFNTRGGGPGSAPSMTKDFHAPGGAVSMDGLHDRSRYYREKEANENRQRTPTYQSLNPMHVSQESLRSFNASAFDGCKWYKGHCVYVVGTERADVVKIGKANTPTKRLEGLQTGNPEKLFFHRLFWFKHPEHANSIERSAHKSAGVTFTRLAGEWFSCSPDQAYVVVTDAIEKDRGINHDEYEIMAPYCGASYARI